MEELQAKWTFDQGGFAKALIAPTPMGAGYHLHLVKFGKQRQRPLRGQRPRPQPASGLLDGLRFGRVPTSPRSAL